VRRVLDRSAANGAQVVWFKRDLRVDDHHALLEASRRGPCICLYVYEPDVIAGDDYDAAHLTFVNESLVALRSALETLGGQLTIQTGRMPDVLEQLHRTVGIAHLWSHEETGNATTYARDRRVTAWTKEAGVQWTQIPCNGVVRRLQTRDGWSRQWHERMHSAVAPRPTSIESVAGLACAPIRGPTGFGLEVGKRETTQIGGLESAEDTLASFLRERGVNYKRDLSSPGPAWTSCSRLSPYLAWGNLSMRQVLHATRARVEVLGDEPGSVAGAPRSWLPSLRSFEQRLRWHCHFIQKLEDEPSIEFYNMNRAYDGLREDRFDELKFAAWKAGQTGFPMVDACMRALTQSGWINFRMRAMLVSFASYHLWLHWRPTALHLARLFVDYEPGIHYSQVQMQSGVTGINTVRIYSPIKQVIDQDPEGEFIRQHCPELALVPSAYLSRPEEMPAPVQAAAGCVIGRDYPQPIVDHLTAYRAARQQMYAVKGSKQARLNAKNVYHKHGSRRQPLRQRASS